MGDVIKKIMEAEKACSEDIEEVRLEGNRQIDEMTNELENKKAQAKKGFFETNKKRFKVAVEEAREHVKDELNEIAKEKNRLNQDKELCEEVKEKTVSIILSS